MTYAFFYAANMGAGLTDYFKTRNYSISQQQFEELVSIAVASRQPGEMAQKMLGIYSSTLDHAVREGTLANGEKLTIGQTLRSRDQRFWRCGKLGSHGNAR